MSELRGLKTSIAFSMLKFLCRSTRSILLCPVGMVDYNKVPPSYGCSSMSSQRTYSVTSENLQRKYTSSKWQFCRLKRGTG